MKASYNCMYYPNALILLNIFVKYEFMRDKKKKSH